MKAGIKKTVLISAMIGSLGLASAATSFAGDHHGKRCNGKQGGEHSMMRGGHSLADRLEGPLSLSKEQMRQIDAITDAQYKTMRSNRREKRNDATALRALDPAAENYQAEVARLAQAAAERAAAQVQSRADVRAQIAAVLTAEQQSKMAALKAEMEEKRGKRRHRDHNDD